MEDTKNKSKKRKKRKAQTNLVRVGGGCGNQIQRLSVPCVDGAVVSIVVDIAAFLKLVQILNTILNLCTFQIYADPPVVFDEDGKVIDSNNITDQKDKKENSEKLESQGNELDEKKDKINSGPGLLNECIEITEGLGVKCMDDCNSAILLAHLQCKVYIDRKLVTPEHMEFCLTVEHLLISLASMNTSHELHLYRRLSSVNIEMKCFSGEFSNSALDLQQLSLPIYVSDPKAFDVCQITSEFDIEFSIHKLRKVMQLASGLLCEKCRFYILGKPKDPIPNTPHDMAFFIIEMYTEHQVAARYCYPSYTERHQNQQTLIIQNSTVGVQHDFSNTDVTSLITSHKVLYNEVFTVKYLSDFIQKLDRQTVVLRLGQGQPLVMSAKFGDNQSSVAFIIGPHAENVTSV